MMWLWAHTSSQIPLWELRVMIGLMVVIGIMLTILVTRNR